MCEGHHQPNGDLLNFTRFSKTSFEISCNSFSLFSFFVFLGAVHVHAH